MSLNALNATGSRGREKDFIYIYNIWVYSSGRDMTMQVTEGIVIQILSSPIQDRASVHE